MERKLKYFNIIGYAESIRYILHYGGLEFEDIRYNVSEWPIKEVKDSLPYGQMPLYQEGDKTLNQSVAIARYLASQTGLLPSDPWDQAKLDAAVLTIYDLLEKSSPYLEEKDPEKKQKLRQDYDEAIKFYFSRFNEELKAGNGYFGGKLSWADFILVTGVEGLNSFLNTNLEKDYPVIEKLVKTIHSLPGVKEYVAKREPCVFPF